ncbi:cytidine deaminase [Caldanaerovirga acetigignens]|uniref:Cytidine deaminase n=1 Tax=Caldanaerovirga acetigignens TaxID=447595 RepID=A0A1M7LUJ8_9FIRM|nr:cytidine deaminase [Caldanaerovirga acetigignens]SHM81898.1 cytidine deaminase [Caldanaerovirga acetigignens]
MEEKRLIKKAQKAMEKAYAPYSGFRVGACVLTSDGVEFTGCNIENASYGLTVCAERVAIFKAYSEGKRNIDALAVVADIDEPVSPCGACRQVMLELLPNALIILSNRDGSKIMRTRPEELLPYGFKL